MICVYSFTTAAQLSPGGGILGAYTMLKPNPLPQPRAHAGVAVPSFLPERSPKRHVERGFVPRAAVLLGLLWSSGASAADGILSVKSPVENAEVFVDGQSLGPAPVTRFLAPGPHALRIVADNFDPFVRKLQIEDGKKIEINAVLSAGVGTAEFVGGAAGARLEIDGKERGMLPMRLSDLTPGVHSWKVAAPKFEATEGSLDFVKGKNYLVEVKLQGSAGVFVVESTPAGADVSIDGKNVGKTPLRLEGIALGVHGVLVQAPDRAAIIRSVDTTDGSRGELKVSLPKAGSSLKITTGSPNAKVLVNGTVIGEGATVKFGPLEKGKAQIVIEADGTRVADTVSVPGSGTLMLHRAGDTIEKQKPLTQRWGFWAAVGGGVAVGAGAGIATAVAVQPDPPPAGDTVVTLP